jgi:hypothetical protein
MKDTISFFMLVASEQRKVKFIVGEKKTFSAEVGKASRVGFGFSYKHLTKLLWLSKGKH